APRGARRPAGDPIGKDPEARDRGRALERRHAMTGAATPRIVRSDADLGNGRVAAIVTLNRPEQLNAIDWDMIHELDACIDGIAGDDRVATVLITGAGRAFSAGGDLKKY